MCVCPWGWKAAAVSHAIKERPLDTHPGIRSHRSTRACCDTCRQAATLMLASQWPSSICSPFQQQHTHLSASRTQNFKGNATWFENLHAIFMAYESPLNICDNSAARNQRTNVQLYSKQLVAQGWAHFIYNPSLQHILLNSLNEIFRLQVATTEKFVIILLECEKYTE